MSSGASASNSGSDQELLTVPHHAFTEQELPILKSILSILTICVEVFLIIGLLFAAFIIQNITTVSQFPFLVYAHIGVWGLLIICDSILSFRVTKLHLHGYHTFSRRISCFNGISSFAFSAGNTLLLLVTVLYAQYSTGNSRAVYVFGIYFTKIHVMRLIVSLENFVCIPLLVWLLVLNIRFYRSCALPDIVNDETFVPIASEMLNLNCRDFGSLEDVVDKQADTIEYLKTRNSILCQRINVLTQHHPC